MVNKKEFPRDISFIDRQGKVVHPRRKDYHARKSAKDGKAYGFFDCNATKDEIECEVPFIRDAVNTPNQLELILTENVHLLKGDSDLLPLAQWFDRKYVIEATYPNATNKQTADELSAVLNQAYQSPLYQEGEKFRGEIVYRESGKYIFRE